MTDPLNPEEAWSAIIDALALGDFERATALLWPTGITQDWCSNMAPRMEFAAGGFEKTHKDRAIFCYEQALALYEAEASGATSGSEGAAYMDNLPRRDLTRKIWLLKS